MWWTMATQEKEATATLNPIEWVSHDDDQQTSDEGADAGGTVSDPTIPDDELGDDGQISANCFGKVIQHEAQEHKEEGSRRRKLRQS